MEVYLTAALPKFAFTYINSSTSAFRAYNLRFLCYSSAQGLQLQADPAAHLPPSDLSNSAIRFTEWVLMAGRFASRPNLPAIGVEEGWLP